MVEIICPNKLDVLFPDSSIQRMRADVHTMFLVLAATEFEMNPFLLATDWDRYACTPLLTGVGPVETGVRLMRYLTDNHAEVEAVVNFGIGGAYISAEACSLLDMCLASREVFGDFGICYPDRVDHLPKELTGPIGFNLDTTLRNRAVQILHQHGFPAVSGVFVTVGAVSGTRSRGDMLQRKYQGICENMEGAAIARVCSEFSLPLLEVRCISNYVEDRNIKRWKLKEACEKAAGAAAILVKEMTEKR